MPDSKLDLSDIPESTAAELRRAPRVGRPASGNAKQLIAIRIAPQLLRRMAANNPNPAKPSSTNSSRNPPAKSPSSPAPISSRVV